MNYKQAIEYIHSANQFGMKLGLENIIKLLQELDNPHQGIKVIHVAGTNGKGSVSSMISSILIESGYKVGLFTSPYLENFNERIKINGINVSDEQISNNITLIKEKIDHMINMGYQHPTEFEIVTALGFLIFKQSKVDFIVLEVGLGGRLDSTNVVTPLICVLTSIGMDHMNILGNDIEKIALEKAAIIKPGSIAVSYPQTKNVYKIIENECAKKDVVLNRVECAEIKRIGFSESGQIFDFKYDNLVLKNLKLNLIGRHQILNAATAIIAVMSLKKHDIKICEKAIEKGLENVKWPGRLEIISKQPLILIDGAHNIDGAKSLKLALKEHFNKRKILMVIGMLEDKDVEGVVEVLAPIAESIITSQPENKRALNPEKMALLVNKYCENVHISDSVEQAVDKALYMCNDDQMIVFCGSLYLVGKVRTIIKEIKNL
ncbi:MAG: bifunctional folylpolyglutamate synthase/dihydrofolate synthase [Clostridia bacterium]|nr:bifunctional folylpolyglutamate synthase/dihydrofolate synthase [Clostridia bacterium]